MAGDLVRVLPKPPAGVPQGQYRPRISTADMAWMAGVIDLKGAMVRKANKTRRTPQVVLSVNTKDERVALRLSVMTGTAPEPRPSRIAEEFLRRGCAEHCVAPHVHVGPYPWQMPRITRWSVTGVAAAVVLANLAPYMSTYNDYAEDAARIAASFAVQGRGSSATYRALSRLAELGWRLPPLVASRLPADWNQKTAE